MERNKISASNWTRIEIEIFQIRISYHNSSTVHSINIHGKCEISALQGRSQGTLLESPTETFLKSSKFQLNYMKYEKMSLYKIVYYKKIYKFKSLHFSIRCINRIFVHFFGIGSVSSYFLWLQLLLDLKMRKKKERQTFRTHMGALFSLNSIFINF